MFANEAKGNLKAHVQKTPLALLSKELWQRCRTLLF